MRAAQGRAGQGSSEERKVKRKAEREEAGCLAGPGRVEQDGTGHRFSNSKSSPFLYLTDGYRAVEIGNGIVFLRDVLTFNVVLSDIVQTFLQWTKS